MPTRGDGCKGITDRKRQTGYVIFVGSNLVSQCSRKQDTVVHSGTESEYKAVEAAVSEVEWVCTPVSSHKTRN